MSRRVAHLGLAGAALLFGSTFVVIKNAVAVLPPLAFVGWRFLLGAALLLAVARPRSARVWRDGLAAGTLLFAGYAAQTIGLTSTSASNSGLITGLYVVFTPLVAAAVHRTRPAVATLVGAVAAVLGLALLTVDTGFTLRSGDVATLLCAVAFAGHIVLLARLAPRHGVVAFTGIQLLVTAVLALASSLVLEGLPGPTLETLPALLLTGIVVSGGAFLLQVGAQRIVGPSRTAIMLALEPVFAAVTAMAVLGERLDARGWVGAAAIMAGIYVVLMFAPPELQGLGGAEAISEAH